MRPASFDLCFMGHPAFRLSHYNARVLWWGPMRILSSTRLKHADLPKSVKDIAFVAPDIYAAVQFRSFMQ